MPGLPAANPEDYLRGYIPRIMTQVLSARDHSSLRVDIGYYKPLRDLLDKTNIQPGTMFLLKKRISARSIALR